MSVFKFPCSCEEALKEGYVDWKGYKNCNYCGSMCPEELAKLIKERKAVMGGSDWKYGYPHKFYVNVTNEDGNKEYLKFYTKHLELIDDEIFKEIIPVINEACGITFDKGKNGLRYSAPYYGFQKRIYG